MKKKDQPKPMKITTSQLSITTKDNRIISISIEEARELYDYLGTIFASKDATPALPDPVVPYTPLEPYRSPWIKTYPWNEPIYPYDPLITSWPEPSSTRITSHNYPSYFLHNQPPFVSGSFVVNSNQHMDRVGGVSYV